MITAPSCGVATVALTVTDDAGRMDTANVVISSTTATTTAPSTAGQNACSITAPSVVIGVCPASASVTTGGGSQTFTASLANTSNTGVTWEVNGMAGGSATAGTISISGVYSPPASVPSPATVTITAVSAVDSTVSADAQVTISAPGKSGGGGGGVDLLTLIALGGAVLATTAGLRRVRAVRRAALPSRLH